MYDFIPVGNTSLLHSQSGAVLNSRQSAYPIGSDPWIGKTLRAVEYLTGRSMAVVTSIGMNTWELVLARASRIQSPVIIVLPEVHQDTEQFTGHLLQEFNLDPSQCCLLFPERHEGDKNQRLRNRDRIICRISDLILPVSIRGSGIFSQILPDAEERVFNRYRIAYKKESRRRPVYAIDSLSPELASGEWLAHFTRSSRGQWPGERSVDYYLSILRSTNEYSHSARQSLRRILSQGNIYGSNKNIRSHDFVAGFTLLGAENAQEMFRYRSNLKNPYFEPYGIALTLPYARSLGLQPVVYGDTDIYDLLPQSSKPLYQCVGKESRWLREQEWRYLGDFDVSNLDPKCTRIIVANEEDRKHLGAAFPYPVVTIHGQ